MDADLLTIEDFKQKILEDYRIAIISRILSELLHKEVLQGKANFSLGGSGKELPFIALAKFFEKGDFWSGYYRDQAFVLANNLAPIETFFYQLYGDTTPGRDIWSMGRQMSNHFATPFIDNNGQFLNLCEQYNIISSLAPLAAQVPRTLGIAQASKLYRRNPHLPQADKFSKHGNEVAFCTIGDASTSEGLFWESINAAAVMQIPLAIFILDDGYGISVPTVYQTAKESISKALSGMQKTNNTDHGLEIYTVKGWDYIELHKTFEKGIQNTRKNHTPVIFHVEELTQPYGHSTSGSHKRYKSAERLHWEEEWDCIKQFKNWILKKTIAKIEELEEIEKTARKVVTTARDNAYTKSKQSIQEKIDETILLLENIEITPFQHEKWIQPYIDQLKKVRTPTHSSYTNVLYSLMNKTPHIINGKPELRTFLSDIENDMHQRYHTYLYIENQTSTIQKVKKYIPPTYDKESPLLNGYEIINQYFDKLFANHLEVLAFGQDVGKIGDVNQGFAGLQAKYGEDRIFDTGIREASIIGQAIGLAMRGFRPIAEIQYLDYLHYGYEQLSDEVSTLHYRTAGMQICPLIIRTRGHRFEGIWHAGSLLGTLIHALRGMIIAVPRNMVQAAGMYNTLLDGYDPALIIECLNGYRLKEELPNNLLDIRIPMGMPEVLREGKDVTLVSYGSTLRIVSQVAKIMKSEYKISCEVIDVQTLLPFDTYGVIVKSLKKTNRIMFIDEDVTCGATSYMLNNIIEKQKGFQYLDSPPRTISACDHRTPYGPDGDYFTKPQIEQIIKQVKEIVRE